MKFGISVHPKIFAACF